MKKNLILATAFGYQISDLKSFVESWKKFCSNAHLIMVVAPFTSEEIIVYLTKSNVDIRIFTAGHFIPSAIHNTRYFKYLDILIEQGSLFENIFLTDVRDVVFQGNIFESVNISGLHCFLEDSNHTVLGDNWNREVLIMNYGQEEASKLENCQIICSGTTLGTLSHVTQYIVTLINERDLNKMISVGGRPDEQALHNYILHTNKLSNIKHQNADGVATVGLTKADQIEIMDNDIVKVYGKIPTVIHQYDRHINLTNHFRGMYG